ncbi:MAG TPA: selenide, water dikinase SelD [Methylomusa anaerophila]|uniref:Selenide, water dikinase n=1 Tax=Methylomusa anaerophila TaxID=1930071 RepID=A0A348AN79_9FIRM|nr:selenide, water dikinase SelD [Methylomusa anaerophila]BBB92527.1 selenide, water dikinase [Methylomusa anaerophila]HML87619.1 selenide, water dikinase SelD [Methylomusa anaerophila]
MVKLTTFAQHGGCAGKIGPGVLSRVLHQLPKQPNDKLLVGLETSDDAGVYQLDDNTALVQTVDFFSPVVDDPYTFGQIAAANSLSDIYAMGGTPLTALNIVGFPICSLGPDVLADILRGGFDKAIESGVVIVGGHTVDNPEPKYGLSVTGIVHPSRIWTNAGAKPGDVLILTKALGTGILATAAKADMLPLGVAAAIQSMIMLNRSAADAAGTFPINACTDITGFGLLGHTYELAAASSVQVELYSHLFPFLPEAADAAAMGLVPAGAYANRDYLTQVTFDDGVPGNIRDLCYDPQTSGGLLFSVPEPEAESLVEKLKNQGIVQATIIGRIKASGKGDIHIRC